MKNKKISKTENFSYPIVKKSKSLSLKNFVIVSIAIYPVWIFWYVFGLDWLHSLINNKTVDILLTIFIFSTINWIFGNRKIRWVISLALNVACFSFLVDSWTDEYSTTMMAFSVALIIYPMMFLIVTFAQFMTWIPFLIKYSYQNRKSLDNIKWE